MKGAVSPAAALRGPIDDVTVRHGGEPWRRPHGWGRPGPPAGRMARTAATRRSPPGGTSRRRWRPPGHSASAPSASSRPPGRRRAHHRRDAGGPGLPVAGVPQGRQEDQGGYDGGAVVIGPTEPHGCRRAMCRPERVRSSPPIPALRSQHLGIRWTDRAFIDTVTARPDSGPAPRTLASTVAGYA